MNRHIEKAKELRSPEKCYNCAETIMMAYADDLGLSETQAECLGCNFGGGMKCGGTCGAITGGLMVLGALGVSSPAVVGAFQRTIRDNHDGMTNCADLLRDNALKGGEKKAHCDSMIMESIRLIDELADKYEINISDEDKQKITKLMEKLKGLDLDWGSIKDQAQDWADQLQNQLSDKDLGQKIADFFAKLWEAICSLFN